MNQTKTHCATCSYCFNGQCSYQNPCRFGSQIEVSLRIEEQIRKEAVKEFALKIESLFAYYGDEDTFSKKVILDRIGELLKEYGVEVEE